MDFKAYLKVKGINSLDLEVFDLINDIYSKSELLHDNINSALIWLNSLPLEVRIRLSKIGKSGSKGEGEEILILIIKEAYKSKDRTYDFVLGEEKWEVKKGINIISGGTNKSNVNNFLTSLTLIEKSIINSDDKEKWNNIHKNIFSDININKFIQICNFIDNIKYTDELEYVMNFIQKHDINRACLEHNFKKEFIDNINGFIYIDNKYIYRAVSNEEFMNNWEFNGITKGNRLKFKPKYLLP